MKKTYNYTVSGSASNAQTWEISGSVHCDFMQLNARVMTDTFQKLTDGKAVYGMPGIGCEGPYDIHRILIEQIRQ